MADLEPLIRFRKHFVEEKQRFIAQLYREIEQMEGQKQVVFDQIQTEKQMADQMQSVEAIASLGMFMDGARKRIRALDRSIGKINTRIESAIEEMRIAYAEMKKVEITQRKRKEKETAAITRKETIELDEIAIEGFRRKQKEQA